MVEKPETPELYLEGHYGKYKEKKTKEKTTIVQCTHSHYSHIVRIVSDYVCGSKSLTEKNCRGYSVRVSERGKTACGRKYGGRFPVVGDLLHLQ